MNPENTSGDAAARFERLELKSQVEEFLYTEAECLDERRYDEWLAMLADDIVYYMPMRRNVKTGDEAMENTRFGKDISWFEEDKWTLAKRVEQIQTAVHWAEEPRSRVCHIVSNVHLLDTSPAENAGDLTVTVNSRFLVYQNRTELDNSIFVGKRKDRLRRTQGEWKLFRRDILLDQSVLTAKALTVFF